MTRGPVRSPQEEIVALLAVQLQLPLGSQGAAIVEMTRAGFPTSQIAELVGTTPNVVHVTPQKKKVTAKPEGAGPDTDGGDTGA